MAEAWKDQGGDSELNEFQWEKRLRESDAKTDQLAELLERYGTSDEAWARIEKEMGWDQPPSPEILELLESPLAESDPDWKPADPVFKNPEHPLVKQTGDIGFRLQKELESRRLLLASEAEREGWGLIPVKMWCVSAKLAGALTHEDFEAGFVIALLKRTLVLWNEAMSALDASAEHLTETEWLESIRQDWMECRAEIVDLMNALRSK